METLDYISLQGRGSALPTALDADSTSGLARPQPAAPTCSATALSLRSHLPSPQPVPQELEKDLGRYLRDPSIRHAYRNLGVASWEHPA